MSEWTMKKFLEDNDQKFLDEIKRLQNEVVFGFYEEEKPIFAQGYQGAGGCELCEPVTAKEVQGYVDKIKELEATIKKLNDRISDLGWQLDSARNINQWGA